MFREIDTGDPFSAIYCIVLTHLRQLRFFVDLMMLGLGSNKSFFIIERFQWYH